MHVTLRQSAVRATLLASMALSCASAQPPSAAKSDSAVQTLSLQANLVDLPVVVRDKKGALVQNLAQKDFALTVDNKPATIRYFDKESNLPLTLGLLVDVSLSQRGVLDQERTASAAFLDSMLTAPAGRAPDRAFIIQFARETELLQDVTDSRPKLQAALKELDTPNPRGGGATSSDPADSSDDNGRNNPGAGRRAGGGTELYDAVFLSAEDIMSKQTGRKAIVILTDGVDSGSRKSLARAIESAQRANLIVYSIYFKGESPHQDYGNRGGGFPGGGRRGGGGYPGGGGGYPGGGGGGGYPGGGGGSRGGGGNENRVDGKKILDRISGETGGRMYEAKKSDDFAKIYTRISEELRSQYRLGYTANADTAADGYHQIQLIVPTQKNFTIQTRDGYYTGK